MTETQGGLDRTLIAGLSWNAASRWGGQLVSWAATLVVVRLLSPEDYGLAGMAAVLSIFVNLVADGGIGTAIVSRRETDPARLSQLHAVSILFGGAACLLVAGLALPLAAFFRDPRLVPLVLVSSLTYLIVGFRVVPLATLQRDLSFRVLARNEFLWVTAGAMASVAGAAAGLGYWALILGPMCGAAVATFAAWLSAPRRAAAPQFRELGDTIRFGLHLLVSRLAGYVNGVADTIVIGRRLDQDALGGYRVAMELASLPLEKVAAVLMQVATPVFASVREHREALSRYLLLMTEALAMIGWPMAIGLSLVADLLVPVVMGEQWRSAILPIQILAIAGAVRCVLPLINSIAVVRGHALMMARVAVLGSPLFFAALFFGSHWGVGGVALAWACGYPLLAAPILVLVLRETGLSFGAYLRALLPATGATIGMAAAVSAARLMLEPALAPAALLAALVATGAVSYGACLMLVARGRLQRIREVIRGRGLR